MFPVHKSFSPILGQSYREDDYSPAFHQLVNKIVSKIYQKKLRRRQLHVNGNAQNFFD